MQIYHGKDLNTTAYLKPVFVEKKSDLGEPFSSGGTDGSCLLSLEAGTNRVTCGCRLECHGNILYHVTGILLFLANVTYRRESNSYRW